MHQPAQNPPVDRQFMRPVVGRKGRPDTTGTTPSKSKKAQKSEPLPSGEDFVVELTTFHIRPRRVGR